MIVVVEANADRRYAVVLSPRFILEAKATAGTWLPGQAEACR